MNFSRVQWRTHIVDGGYEKIIDPDTGKSLPEDNWVWSPQGLIAMHCPEQWGEVLFSDGGIADLDNIVLMAYDHAKNHDSIAKQLEEFGI